ncbi:acyl dehydratase [Conyzicola lurida]|uniref:Acyl dehydratase n=1 Tax=Conyzicola lurida TaxID=1172621 RepID=A0A841AS92_9MICO|nr:MaoC family dehydratase [Conyzicola lurida]MBB5844651.1 acyl dehydratase [Conyzicola lurida]
MTTDFLPPLHERHFEDYPVGLVAEFGPARVSDAEIVAFATAFDPHAMHTDAEAARSGPFGGLIASGWHTTAVMMKLMVDNFLNERTSLGSPGVDELRFPLPVRAGDELTARFTVVAARPSASKPDRGLLHTRIELSNQRGEVVMTQVMMNLVRRRDLG